VGVVCLFRISVFQVFGVSGVRLGGFGLALCCSVIEQGCGWVVSTSLISVCSDRASTRACKQVSQSLMEIVAVSSCWSPQMPQVMETKQTKGNQAMTNEPKQDRSIMYWDTAYLTEGLESPERDLAYVQSIGANAPPPTSSRTKRPAARRPSARKIPENSGLPQPGLQPT